MRKNKDKDNSSRNFLIITFMWLTFVSYMWGHFWAQSVELNNRIKFLDSRHTVVLDWIEGKNQGWKYWNTKKEFIKFQEWIDFTAQNKLKGE